MDSQNSTRRAHSAKIALGLVTIAGDGIWNLELTFQWLESGSFFEAWRPRGKKSALGQESVSGRSHRAVLSTELWMIPERGHIPLILAFAIAVVLDSLPELGKIGSAACGERVVEYVAISAVAEEK